MLCSIVLHVPTSGVQPTVNNLIRVIYTTKHKIPSYFVKFQPLICIFFIINFLHYYMLDNSLRRAPTA